MTRRSRLMVVAGALSFTVGAFLAVIAGDALASAAFPGRGLSLPPAGEFTWAIAFYLVGVVASAVAAVATFRRAREAPWGWIAGSVAAALFLVPVVAIAAGSRPGGFVFGVWAVAFVELAVAWAAALAGRWALVRLAPPSGGEPPSPRDAHSDGA